MTQKIIKYVLIVFAVGSISYACNSNNESKTSTDVTTDSTAYKNKAMIDSLNATTDPKVADDGPGAGGGYIVDKKSDDGAGAGGGYLAGEKVKKVTDDGAGAGGGYLAGEKKVKKVTDDGAGAGGGYLAGQKKDKKK